MRPLLVALAVLLCGPRALADSPPDSGPSTQVVQAQLAPSSPAPEAAAPAAGVTAPSPSPAPAPSMAPASPLQETSPKLAQFGLGIDFGFPDVAGVMGVWRPVSMLRIGAGVTYNTMAFGVRGSATFVPFSAAVEPTLTLEVGHYFTSGSNSLLSSFVGSNGVAAQTFQHLSYDFGNAQVGLELGISRVTFFLHVGLSYVKATVHDFQTLLEQQTNDPSLEAGDPSLTFTSPSAKLGILFYF